MRNSVLLATLLATLATACTGSIDPGDPDTQPPASEVQVAIRDGQSPQAGVQVIFQDAVGGLVADMVTDGSGVAKAELPAGGTVSVVRTYPVEPGEEAIPAEVYTYVGVKGGDRLSIGKPASERGAASAILVKVPELANGTVKISAPCGAGQGTGPLVAITVRDCAPDIGLYVVDGAGLSFFKRAAYAENIDVSGESLVDSLTSTIAATNVAPNTQVNVEQRLGSSGWDFYSTGRKRVDQAPANVTLPPLTGVEILTLTSVSGNNRTQIVASRKPYTSDISVVDASAGLIVSVSRLEYKPTGITWTEEGTGAPDAVIATLTVARDELTGTREFVRHVIAPHTSASLTVPVLPGAAGALYNPVMDDQVGTALGIAKASGGYDMLRGRAFSTPSVVDATPVDAQITLSYSGAAPGL